MSLRPEIDAFVKSLAYFPVQALFELTENVLLLRELVQSTVQLGKLVKQRKCQKRTNPLRNEGEAGFVQSKLHRRDSHNAPDSLDKKHEPGSSCELTVCVFMLPCISGWQSDRV